MILKSYGSGLVVNDRVGIEPFKKFIRSRVLERIHNIKSIRGGAKNVIDIESDEEFEQILSSENSLNKVAFINRYILTS